ncbi:hypothetical protein FNV43_RR20815 [Rhamnella rubrinervis]|uniref:Ninja-family protein n=1 Tax=Rhamnella rubrinervis TaxID=2594499 RepID=A0A8K0E1G1_9ROSA|nr:hypothetical protein FNV43_RR20815 [Rhamnella rubrinervis]
MDEEKAGQTEFSMRKNENPTNFLQRFSPEKTTSSETENSSSKEPQQPDLSLRLSLGGLYYSEKSNEKPPLLARSSSDGGVITQEGGDTGEPKTPPPATMPSFLSLSRSCSLPAETEKTTITIKDLQAMRRMVAKKRLVDRQRGYRAALEEERSPPPPAPLMASEMAAWAAASATKSAALTRALAKIKSQGFVFGRREFEGPRDITSTKSMPEQREKEPAAFAFGSIAKAKSAGPAENNKLENALKKVKVSSGIVLDNGMDVMNKMPSVTTTGDGPNGRKIEGFLYKYTKSQVSIVCVCHGSFLTPAEFVRHAGGTDVENPMKHINVLSNSFPF